MTRGARWVRWILLPALVIASAFLASWSYRSTRELERAAERNLLASTVELTTEKVERVERTIASYDNAVLHLLNPDDLEPLVTRWTDVADRISPTVRSILVLDQAQRVLRHISRDDPARAQQFRETFQQRILPELHLPDQAIGAHEHFQGNLNGRPFMVSYLTRELTGRRHYLVLEVDMDYIVRNLLRTLFPDPLTSRSYNITDEDGRLIVGKALTSSSEFVVSKRFANTLSRWRLSVAAESSNDLDTREKRRRLVLVDSIFVAIALSVLVLGVVFLAFAARNEQRLNRLKSDFIATVSHELKTPLSLIRMFGEMLASDRVPSESKRKQYLDIIVRESERLTALIENVLDFAKVERGKAAYEFRQANLGDVVSRAVELFRWRLERDDQSLVLSLAGDVPDSQLDERALQLLLFNLLDNAVKYAGAKPIIVRVRGSAVQKLLVLEVEDGGEGIQEDDARRLFERFYRGRNAGGGGVRGSGIGLALVKHIAQAHGGEVSVRNVPPRGALFSVTLPVRTPNPELGSSGSVISEHSL